jgi:dTDP-4-dehydrorhamnose reductase
MARIAEHRGTDYALAAHGPADLSARRPTSGDAVINCAGAIAGDRARLWAANADLAGELAGLCAARDVRLVHLSSCAVFDGLRAGELTEDHPVRPRTLYGTSKAEGEARVRARHPDAVIVRPSKIFGGADPRRRLHTLTLHVLRGRPLPMPASPALWANFVWIDDAAGVIADLALEPGERTTVHLNAALPWPRFAELLAQTLGVPVRAAPRIADPCLNAVASIADRLPPGHRGRGLDRFLEIWDRLRVFDSTGRLGIASVRHGMVDVAQRVRP